MRNHRKNYWSRFAEEFLEETFGAISGGMPRRCPCRSTRRKSPEVHVEGTPGAIPGTKLQRKSPVNLSENPKKISGRKSAKEFLNEFLDSSWEKSLEEYFEKISGGILGENPGGTHGVNLWKKFRNAFRERLINEIPGKIVGANLRRDSWRTSPEEFLVKTLDIVEESSDEFLWIFVVEF